MVAYTLSRRSINSGACNVYYRLHRPLEEDADIVLFRCVDPGRTEAQQRAAARTVGMTKVCCAGEGGFAHDFIKENIPDIIQDREARADRAEAVSRQPKWRRLLLKIAERCGICIFGIECSNGEVKKAAMSAQSGAGPPHHCMFRSTSRCSKCVLLLSAQQCMPLCDILSVPRRHRHNRSTYITMSLSVACLPSACNKRNVKESLHCEDAGSGGPQSTA